MRGIAALCVPVFHAQALFNGRQYSFFNWAYLCVDLFFILSGIVLTQAYEKRILAGTITFGQFVRARVARMGPMHWFTLCAVAASDFIVYHTTGEHITAYSRPVYNFMLNVFFLHNVGLTDGIYFNQAAWSISTEMVVNVIWFVMIAKFRAPTWVFAAIIGVSMLYLVEMQHYKMAVPIVTKGIFNLALVRCVAGFFLGVIFHREILSRHGSLTSTNPLAVNLASMALLAVMAFCFYFHDAQSFEGVDYVAVFLFFPGLIYAALMKGSWIGFALRFRPLVWLGERSYSIYMVHLPIWYLIPTVERLSGHDLPVPIKGFAFLAVTLLVSELTYRLIEMPARRAIMHRGGSVSLTEPVMRS
jgi:peptidoglycan/LPS O-acetylase OafA/YrhL